MNKISVIQWLKKYLDKPNLKGQDMKPPLHFSLLWSVFERTYFPELITKCSVNRKLLKVSETMYIRLPKENLKEIYDFFKERYTTENQTNSKYDRLKVSTDKVSTNKSDICQITFFDLCQTTLTEENPLKLNMTKTVLLIIYKLRCNLVHGEKVNTMFDNEELFIIINDFLMHLIELKEKSINNQQIKSK